ncbi:glutamate-5-semialdehyde dehydrogenase [Heliorestis acidaminivorans]|uniref:Gamma-glutamyl phosphate reductase n=1 Tax=Heliorestis acidaminivorans TaxID=553427 RepID=A0A6I0F1P0_9FIRM|nr:glutamate-5-semialdehyde dehydrogenase [Heliorestis acidaminivorans]KAB2952321.1 glutamate-5-semialdehyde dehydrogenase [Heliorestis acidaminivorans]
MPYPELVLKGKKAKDAAYQLGHLSSQVKDKALEAMAEALIAKEEEILAANALDVESGRKKGLSKALLDRLLLTPKRIEEMAEGLYALVGLSDPIGEVVHQWKRPNGLEIGQVRVPLGVVGIIYEARPNVTVDAAGLCLKTGNAVLLRGGSEAIRSNMTITRIIAEAAEEAGIPAGAIQLIETTDREAAQEMMKMNEYLDVLIPRGGAGLIQTVVKNATVPVIETGVGNCHVYVDSDADLEMAENIVINAKTHRPGVCNAMETLLVHKDVAKKFLPPVSNRLMNLNVELRGCPRSVSIVPGINEATEEDYNTEFLDLILAIRVVNSFEEALDHIRRHGSGHSEAIVTNNYSCARQFTRRVDSAAVYVNASTRFTDGYQYGLGAEIGISTQKLHARGPMGLNELTTIKYVCYGDGQIRQ